MVLLTHKASSLSSLTSSSFMPDLRPFQLKPSFFSPPLSSAAFPSKDTPSFASQFSRNPKFMKVNADESGRMMLASSNSSYAAPLEASSGSSFMMRPLAEILRDLNKRIPDQVLKDKAGMLHQKYIPWYQANRMLSFYAPGWCGEVRDITFSADGKFVTVIYRVTIRGSDGEAYREASGTVSTLDTFEDPTQKAEAMAFVRACARFGLGLYLHHEEGQ